jgi:nucleoside-diphosphate-sugar epimerase
VHLAFPTDARVRRKEPLGTLEGVIRDAIGVVRLGEALGAHHVVIASSGKVFGPNAELPIRDCEPTHPTTELGRLKLDAEDVVRARAAGLGIDMTSLRIFNAYGQGQRPGFFFPTLLSGLAAGHLRLGELDHARDWVHVTDVASAVVTALDHPPSPGDFRAFNVGTGHATTVRQILELVRGLVPTMPEIEVVAIETRSDEAPIERTDAAGLRALGWEPATTFERGLEELVVGQGTGAR